MTFRLDDQVNDLRVEVMAHVLNQAFGGTKAQLGRRLGYKDGSFVGQMLRKERPITEATFWSLLDLFEVRSLDLSKWLRPANRTVVATLPAPGSDKPSDFSFLAGSEVPPQVSSAPELDVAIPVVLDAIARCTQRDKLRTAMLALLDDDAPAYRQRVAELLVDQPRQDLDGPQLTAQEREDARAFDQAVDRAAGYKVKPKKNAATS